MVRIRSDLQLIAKKLDGSKWQLVDDLYYHVGSKDSEEVIIVKAGFITDGASTPFGVRNLFPKDGTYTPAAAIHDALYRYRGILPFGWYQGLPKEYSRKRCDSIFAEAMQVLGVSWWRRKIMYRALRLFGGFAWHRKENSPGRP